MRAVLFDRFGERPVVAEVPDPAVQADGVIIRVETTGLCRSDIHGWQGHDSDIRVPHVPGHEFVGTIESVGAEVTRFVAGQRVTTPFVCACGACAECLAGDAQVCRNQTQPGFTHWGSYAELVAVRTADVNLIPVAPEIDGAAAALLGCRFATAYRGVVDQGRLAEGDWLLVVGAGGVGLSCVLIARALGARVVAVDVSLAALETARELGADVVIDSSALSPDSVVAQIVAATGGGAQVSVDALGRAETMQLCIRSLARRGRHIQIGLFAEDPPTPLPLVIARELEIRGSHGMAAADYGDLLALVGGGKLRPQRIVRHRIRLDDVPEAMERMRDGLLDGVTVIEVSPGGDGAR